MMNYLSSSLVILRRSKADRPPKGIFTINIFVLTYYDCNPNIFDIVYIKVTIFRTLSAFLPGNADTIIDFECVPTYSQSLTAQIINMNDNVIIPQTSLKSGMIADISL